MNRTLRILKAFLFCLSTAAVWLVCTVQALAQNPPGPAKPSEGGVTDYTLSYMVVLLGVVLGLLVIAKASNRRDRDRPAGYVERNIGGEE